MWELGAATSAARRPGYVELRAGEEGSVEIVYFGLLPAFRGRGIGGHLLS
ncbi:hypothetical protein SFUMM280S_06246 [Streptomyces fumanus]